MSGYTLIIGLLLLASDVRGNQGVMYYLRKLFFSGSRLCQGMLLSFLLSGFLQEGTQQQTSFQGTIWLSGCPCWIEGDPVLGGCCRSHGPYKVGPSSATTPIKGSLIHDGGTSNAPSTLQDNPVELGQHSCCPLPRPSGGIACYKQGFRLSKTSHDLDEAVLDFLSKHLAPQTTSGYGYAFRKFWTFLCAATG